MEPMGLEPETPCLPRAASPAGRSRWRSSILVPTVLDVSSGAPLPYFTAVPRVVRTGVAVRVLRVLLRPFEAKAVLPRHGRVATASSLFEHARRATSDCPVYWWVTCGQPTIDRSRSVCRRQNVLTNGG